MTSTYDFLAERNSPNLGHSIHVTPKLDTYIVVRLRHRIPSAGTRILFPAILCCTIKLFVWLRSN